MPAAQVRPDGSGLRRVFDSHGGLANHPKFSPKFTPEAGRIVFTSDHAGYSAEEIALPHQFQPYGDLFAINIDGTDLQRLTHGRCFLPNLGTIKPSKPPFEQRYVVSIPSRSWKSLRHRFSRTSHAFFMLCKQTPICAKDDCMYTGCKLLCHRTCCKDGLALWMLLLARAILGWRDHKGGRKPVLCCADPYENGTPTWGSDGTPVVRAKQSTKLSCSFDDSVEWLRPKQPAMSKTRGDAQNTVMQRQASTASFWCPFAESKKAAGVTAPSK